MSPRRLRRYAVWIAAALLAAALLPPLINANRFRKQLADTISRSLGRPVQMGDVHFQLVPQPGFVVSNLAIADDPAFSSEPVLRAESVTASLRLTSLWRGRLEISKLSFDYPSLNLVRAANGRWNVEAVLQQASQVPAAPTAKLNPEQRPRFPYIEASNGRINFRIEQEKRPHALMDADFALWLESENQWNTRLEARPTRTDANLNDTGLVRLEGWLRKGDTLANTEIKLDVNAEKAQLGQWTRLIFGRDQGWRGDTQLEAHLAGKATDFTFDARAAVRDFHRHDVSTRDSLDATLNCKGKVTVPSGAPAPIIGLECTTPSLGGSIAVSGDVAAHRHPSFSLDVRMREVSMGSLTNLFRHVKKDVPEDLAAEGAFTGEYHVERPFAGAAVARGAGRVSGLTLASEALSTSLAFTDLDVQFPTARRKEKAAPMELVAGPTETDLGGTSSVIVTARLRLDEVNVEAKGDADLEQLSKAANLVGLADPRYKFSGGAAFAVAVQGVFKDFSAPVLTGTAQLRDVRTLVDGVAAPLLIQSAGLQVGADKVALQRLVARLEGTGTLAGGSVEVPRHCPEEACTSTFDLKAAQVSLDEFNRALNPRYRSTGWLSLPLRFFEGKPVKSSRLMTLRSSGKIAISRLVIKNLVATNVSAGLRFDRGQVALTGVRGTVLGGRHSGSWEADMRTPEPEYRGRGTVEGVAVTQVNSLLRGVGGAGTLNLSYELSLRGGDAESLRKSAAGAAQFHWRNGSWKAAPGSPGLQFTAWNGRASLANGAFEVAPSVMQTRSGSYQVSGRIGLDRSLNLKLDGRKDQMLVTGTVLETRVAVQAAEQMPARDPASNLKNASPVKVQN